MMKKRIFSLLLIIAMLMSMLPVIASAEEAATKPSIKTMSLTLHSVFTLNVKVDPTGADKTEVRVYIGSDTTYQSATEPTESNGLRVYTAKIPAHRLGETVRVELWNGTEAEKVDEETWTLEPYLANAVEKEPPLQAVTTALTNYNTYAAYYVNGGTAPNVDAVNDVKQAALESYKAVSVKASTDSDLGQEAGLFVDNAVDLRIKFNAENWSSKGYTLYIDEQPVELKTEGEKVVYEISEINPQKWGEKISIRVMKDTEKIYEVSYGVLSYAYSVLGGQNSDAKLQDLMKAMYLYAKEVKTYVELPAFDYSVTYVSSEEEGAETKTDSESRKSVADSKDFEVDANPFTAPLGYKFAGWKRVVNSTTNALTQDFTGDLPAAWTYYDNAAVAETGVWSVNTDGALHFTQDEATKNGNSAAISDIKIEADNYELTADVVVTSAGSVGLVWAVSDDAETMHYFRIFGSGGQYKLYAGQITGGLDGNMATGAANSVSVNDYVSGNTKAAIKVKVEGQKYTIFINENNVASGTATGNLHGRVGAFLRNGPAATKNAFDNFCVNTFSTSESTHAAGEKLTINSTDSSTAATLYAQWDEITLLNEQFNSSTVPAWSDYYNSTPDSSPWSVNANGALTNSGAVSETNLLISDTSVNAMNYELTADVRIPAGNENASVGLVFASDATATKYHYFRIWCNSSRVYKLYSGYVTNGKIDASSQNKDFASGSDLSVASDLWGQVVTLKVKVEGNKFTLYMNDSVLLEQKTSTAGALHGRVGVYARGSVSTYSFDNIKVTAPKAVTFEDLSEMSAVPSTWTPLEYTTQTGGWKVQNGALQYQTEADAIEGCKAILLGEVNEGDYAFSATMHTPETGSANNGNSVGLILGGSNDDQTQYFLRLWVSGDTIQLTLSKTTRGLQYLTGVKSDGDTDANNSSGVSGNQDVTLAVKVVGNKLEVYVDGVLRATFSENIEAELLHGKIGLGVRQNVTDNAFDSILVEKIEVAAE